MKAGVWPKNLAWCFKKTLNHLPKENHPSIHLAGIYQWLRRAGVGGNMDWNHPPWPGTTVTICMSYFMTRGPDKEYGTDKPPSTGRIRGQVKRRHQSIMSYKPPRILLAGIHLDWAMCAPSGRRLSKNDHPETTWKLTVSSSSCFPGGTRGKEPAWNAGHIKRHGFNPWIRKIPWRREW